MNKKTIFVLLTLIVLIASLTAINAANTTDNINPETTNHIDTQTNIQNTQMQNTTAQKETQQTTHKNKKISNTKKELKNTNKTTKTIKNNNAKKNLKQSSYSTISLDLPSKINYGQNITPTVTVTDYYDSNIDGHVEIYLDGSLKETENIQTYYYYTRSKSLNFNLGKTSPGNHKILARYTDYNDYSDYNYNTKEITKTITVLKPTVVTTQYLSTNIHNTKIKVKVASNDNTYPNGLVRIYSNNKLYSTQLLENGETIFNLKLPGGIQQITAKYVGSSRYMPSQRINSANILKDKTSISTSLTKSITSNTSFKVNVRDSNKNIIKNGNIQVLEEGKIVANGKIVNGAANIKLRTLPGTHTYTFKYLGDTNHYQSTQTRTVRTYKTATSMNIQVLKNTPEALVKVTVRGVDKQLAFTGGFHIINNGKVISIFRIYNGTNTIKLNLNEGSQKVTFKYLSNQYYNPSTKIQTINTIKQRTSIQVTTRKAFSSNTTFTIKVLDQNKKLVPMGNVQVLENGKPLSNTKLVNGAANIKLIQNPGNHTYTFKYIANKNYKQSQLTKKVRIYKSITTMTTQVIKKTPKNAKIQVTIRDVDNALATKGTVEIREYGKVITRSNVKNGVATLNPSFKLGNHKIRITYVSNNIYNPSSQLETIYIHKEYTSTTLAVTKTVASDTNFEITVKDSNDNTIKNGNIHIYDDYNIIANGKLNNGVADIRITQPEGYHEYTAIYEGNDYYQSSEATEAATIYKSDTTTSTSISSATVMDTTLYATIYDSEGKLVKKGTVNILENGDIIGEANVKNGEAKIKLDMEPGNHDITINYLSNDLYYGSEEEKTLYIKDDSIEYDYHTITFNKFKNDGTPVNAAFDDGTKIEVSFTKGYSRHYSEYENYPLVNNRVEYLVNDGRESWKTVTSAIVYYKQGTKQGTKSFKNADPYCGSGLWGFTGLKNNQIPYKIKISYGHDSAFD